LSLLLSNLGASMNTVLKVGAASALTLAGVAAHASIPSPSSGSSDAVLFAEVLNASGTAIASYAGDTGVSINTLTAGTYSGTALGSDANLAKLFAADGTGDTLYWGVLGGQYTSIPTSFPTSGALTFLTTTASSSTTKIKGIPNSTLTNWATGIAADISTINSNSGGASSVEGANPATSGVWDVANGTTNIAGWYGSLSNSNTLGGTQTLFSELTSAGTSTTKGTFAAVETVGLSADGLTFAGLGGTPPPPPPPVPLPAAVWLLGSGLLGLAGVARRKSKA
jgi:hypothetical protein